MSGEGPRIQWDQLPARVEGVISERIARLEPALRETLNAASVMGEEFTAEALARVLNADERVVGAARLAEKEDEER